MANVLHPDEDWQSRRSVIECNKHMLAQQLGCDVTFNIVRGETVQIRAHKYVLGSRSCVFYAMFYGPLSENTGTEIDIPDMTPEQFNDLLQFLYTDDIKVTLDNVLSMLYAAKKYCVQSLIDKCLNTLKRHMVPENVCTVMENAHCYGNNDLKTRCHNLIVQEPERVFQADDLAELCNECFISIIKDDSIPVHEEIIFDAVIKFGQGKCVRNDQGITPENMKRLLADVIPHVRFPLMSQEYFLSKVTPHGLLTEQEELKLCKYFLKKVDYNGDFNANKRKFIYTVQRFTDLGSGWGYKRDKCDAITFSCSHDIKLRAFLIYGSNQGPGNLEIRMHLKQEPYRANVTVKGAIVETDGKQKIYKVFFDDEVILKKDKKYIMSLVVKGPTTYYGTAGQGECVIDNVKFTFEKSDLSTNNTTTERGQLPGLAFELMPNPVGVQPMEL
ncbi:BTB/POZ domain-containing protein 6-like [Ruditapes philippinarum]|uniref:BTB/POZ domain-containing protein 6-like n=1 Tax=Ruditapes philippinarum TaxID=129788 RepID=UPI00295A6990|nr:BTB/POZ domain-containing protein 6-like [Ruditapes philippinarum]XP_060602061.1 BTB/POZ domain-containing protein 6-like [Ruditapes philippinarum]